jgi:hypothetical protein
MMKFRIERISNWDIELSPHPNALREKVVTTDKELKNHPRSDWDIFTQRGANHRVEGDFFVRDLEVEAWVIEINTLEELMRLGKEVNEPLIIFEDEMRIEIYDSYRE